MLLGIGRCKNRPRSANPAYGHDVHGITDSYKTHPVENEIMSIIKISEEQVLQMEMNNNSIAGAITFDVPLERINPLRLIVIDCHL